MSKIFAEVFMRKILPAQIQMGEIDVSAITIELDNRDEIPQLLRGLQFIYNDKKTRAEVFKLLWKIVPKDVDKNNGRQGMNLWRILVLGMLRLTCNCDFDKLQELANNHWTLRQMLGHGLFDNQFNYHRQTLNDNLRLFTPEVLDQINQIVANAGIKLSKDATGEQTDRGRCDSFVLETDVHFPTDINLLWDAVRKSMLLSEEAADYNSISGWRQSRHNLREIKSLYRTVQIERDREKESNATLHATQRYVDRSMTHLQRAEQLVEEIGVDALQIGIASQIKWYVDQGKKQIDQICRRCFNGEKIPHEEKIFSLFEPHTEWISKGKAGVPQELGLRVCIMESSTGFILHYKVMEQETDDAIAVEMVKETLKKFPCIRGVSFDKGFHSPNNQKELGKMLDHTILPRKGKLNAEQKAIEESEEFVSRRRHHSAVESAINALENHGLDRCCDNGIDGFKRYVALAVLARNIQLIGAILRKQQLVEISKAA
jgi:hypothetical protein